MTNFNVNIPTKEFYDSREHPLTAVPTTTDLWFNKGCSAFTIEVSGATTIYAQPKGTLNITDVEGDRLDAAHMTFTPLSVINLTNFTLSDSITSNGLYLVVVSGVAALKLDFLNLSGNVTIVGSSGEGLKGK